MKDEKSFVNLGNARDQEQVRVMETIRQKGECPFCPENLTKYHKKPIIREGTHWILTENQWPYKNTRIHLMAIHRQHAERLADLSSEAWSDLGSLVAWAEHSFSIIGGAVGLRFGDPALNGASVRHLHVQVITVRITDKEDPAYQPVRLKVG